MPLFQNSVVTKYLRSQDKTLLSSQWLKFKNHFHNPTIQDNIRNSKEEQYQGEFLIDLFVNVLGYTKNPTPDFNLTTEHKNVKDSKKADGAIIINEAVKAVIELKGTNTTDLNKIEVQAFGYKNNQPECKYIITSNYEKLRFYIDNATEHLEFNLFKLTEKEFELLYLCLGYDNIDKDIPKKIKEDSISVEKNITKNLYSDYSLFKRELHRNLVAQNSDFDELLLFKKSQKLLDRFLFLFFAEDRQLLPPNSVRLILNDWRDLQDRDEDIPLYNRFKKYFEYLNTGFKGKRYDVFAYNGGLFKPDEVLDKIKIDNELLFKHTYKLSEYDFLSEVDVNILGHIFENSLNELDEIKAQLDGTKIDKSNSKRKKDGVFYTPKYITKYIVDNTVGKLCNDKKTELKLIEDDYITDKKRNKITKQPLLEKLTNYRHWLINITICDPACGSGAFLNEAFNFLISEHRYIDELRAKLFGDALVLSDVEKSILENNLFGVDLNEESVEIAKLSLWLRTAQPNRKLNDLNNNIKKGNSLINDIKITEDAFDWHEQFPQVFENGGFDVIIGNPPYVRVQNMNKLSIKYFEKTYLSATGKFDIYVLFNELSIKLINKNGIISFIQPHKFINSDFGSGLRNFFIENTFLSKIISFSDIDIFEGATTYTGIFLITPKANDFINFKEFKNISAIEVEKELFQLNEDDFIKTFYKEFNNNWIFKSREEINLINKLKSFDRLIDYTKNISQGIIPGTDKLYYLQIIEEREETYLVKNQIDDAPFLVEKALVKKVIKGNNLARYLPPENDYFILYPYTLENNIQKLIPEDLLLRNFPFIHDYFLKHKDFLIELRKKYKTNPLDWYGFHRSREMRFLNSVKILTTHAAIEPSFTISENHEYFNQNVYGIELNPDLDIKYFLALLNSKVTAFFIKNVSTMINGGYYLYKTDYLVQLPIKINNKISASLIESCEKILSLNEDLQKKSLKFKSTISRKFIIGDFSTKLENWFSLTYPEFVRELSKKKIKLSLSEEADWEDYFNTEAIKVLEIRNAINQTDKNINKIVYELYSFTPEEIEIVENS